MRDFIFSVNVTFPIFLVMVIGWVLHQIGMLDEILSPWQTVSILGDTAVYAVSGYCFRRNIKSI